VCAVGGLGCWLGMLQEGAGWACCRRVCSGRYVHPLHLSKYAITPPSGNGTGGIITFYRTGQLRIYKKHVQYSRSYPHIYNYTHILYSTNTSTVNCRYILHVPCYILI